MASPPNSPTISPNAARPVSSLVRPARSSSRMSTSSRPGGGGGSGTSRLSDEDSSRTSVKVAVRVRPPLKPSDPGFELIPQRFQRSMVQVTSPTSLAIDSPQGRKIFVFDRVFGPDIHQEGIWEYLGESVNAFIQGYNVSLLAYGQSGAGKSYTMGTSDPSEQVDQKVMGVIPRAAAALFEKLAPTASKSSNSGLRTPVRYSTPVQSAPKAKAPQDKNWTMKATYVEIYNEQLRDLLLPESTPLSDRRQVIIREDTKGRILLTGLHEVTINSIDDLLGALNFGSSIRQTDATAINAKSSRSHAVFSLNLIQQKPRSSMNKESSEKRYSAPVDLTAVGSGSDSLVTVDSKFHFVDLAGSERLKNTGAQGERVKEGISINAGLASLGKVISQLSSRQAGSHVSYRDSKLTRLLQDSLGGNAITYMVACVTPAEFHLSETLNTVQYAQRARAIQSKPRIQEVSVDGDMKALVERLRAEIAFLREQIRNSERGSERSSKNLQDRSERANEREYDLQNQLLDLQENYSALSQRHAKLISEITKARDSEEQPAMLPILDSSNTAVERLARSNSFAEAVEQVVLEYEKTIQSLESSLSSTRSTLASTESSLLEKETKLAYIETINSQLQARVQKMMDREASTELYLHDLEGKLNGQASGEEKSTAIVAELRKEITRARENEASCEDYISTLEERLAEADQDMEMMQREIDRLEHVVERQRSLGKLDNLLHELDSLAQDASRNGVRDTILSNEGRGENHYHDDKSDDSKHSGSSIPFEDERNPERQTEGQDSEVKHAAQDSVSAPKNNGDGFDGPSDSLLSSSTLKEPEHYLLDEANGDLIENSLVSNTQAQNDTMADKLENVTQELFDLKVEHENTLNEFTDMASQYEVALRQIRDLQDQLDERRHHQPDVMRPDSPPTSSQRPSSFLAATHISELKQGESYEVGSRSLSSELKSIPNDSTAEAKVSSPTHSFDDHSISDDEDLTGPSEENDMALSELREEHDRLIKEHEAALALVEELKSDMSRTRMNGVTSPSTVPVLRRKSSQSLVVLDRANRSFKSLKSLASQYLEGHDDAMEVFELSLGSVTHEMQTRSERIQELENEVVGLRKDMETKAAMINGLARERSSINNSPMDISVVSSLQHRLKECELELDRLNKSHAAREADLGQEVNALKDRLEARTAQHSVETEEVDLDDGGAEDPRENLHQDTPRLEQSNISTASKEKVFTALQELEDQIAALQFGSGTQLHGDNSREVAMGDAISLPLLSSLEIEQPDLLMQKLAECIEKNKAAVSRYIVDGSRREGLIDSNNKMNGSNSTTGDGNAQIESKSNIDSQTHDEHGDNPRTTSPSALGLIGGNNDVGLSMIERDMAVLRDKNQQLEEELKVAQNKLQDASASLSQAQAKVLEESRASAEVSAVADALRLEIEGLKSKMENETGQLASLEKEFLEAGALIETLQKEKTLAEEDSKSKRNVLEKYEAEIAVQLSNIEKQQISLNELQDIHFKSQQELEDLNKKENKHTEMIDQLEQQLTTTYDQHQDTSKKLSEVLTELEATQMEHAKLMEESQQASIESKQLIETLSIEVNNLQTKLTDVQLELAAVAPGAAGARAQRSNSVSSTNLRKSASTASLPSPPPVIPLPPLPSTISSTTSTTTASNAAVHPPPTPTMSRRPSKDYVVTHLEDQEARIKTLEKQLQAEKALTATLEEALTDCEKTMKRLTADKESYQMKANQVQQELDRTRNESQSSRYSMQAMEDERLARLEAERAKEALEKRMEALSRKKKKNNFACF